MGGFQCVSYGTSPYSVFCWFPRLTLMHKFRWASGWAGRSMTVVTMHRLSVAMATMTLTPMAARLMATMVRRGLTAASSSALAHGSAADMDTAATTAAIVVAGADTVAATAIAVAMADTVAVTVVVIVVAMAVVSTVTQAAVGSVAVAVVVDSTAAVVAADSMVVAAVTVVVDTGNCLVLIGNTQRLLSFGQQPLFFAATILCR